MNGYVQNKTNIWAHAMKRSIGPNAKVPLDELYEQYGTKHNLKKGKEFVEWLRTVKLKDESKWMVIFDEKEINPKTVTKAEVKETNVNEGTVVQEQEQKVIRAGRAPDNVSTINVKDMEVKDVVGLSVRKAREVLPNVMDLNLLKYAVQEANQLANKDTLVRMLRKRIQELDLAR